MKQSSAIFEAVQGVERMASTAIDAFTAPDRLLAIESIALHKRLQERLTGLRGVGQSQYDAGGSRLHNDQNRQKNPGRPPCPEKEKRAASCRLY